MMIRYLLITILLALNCSLLGQNKNYSQTDFSKDLKIHQLETESRLKKIEQVEAVTSSEIKRVDSRIDDLRDGTSNYLTILGIVVAISSVVVAVIIAIFMYIQNQKIKENKKLIEEEKKKIEKIREDINELRTQAKEFINEIKSHHEEACNDISDIRNYKKESIELINILKQTNNKSKKTEETKDEKLTIQTHRTAKYIKDNIPINNYTSDDWFILGYEAQENEKLEDACYFYSKSNEMKEDSTTLNNWASALDTLGDIGNDQKLLYDAISKCERAIYLNSHLSAAYYNLGTTLMRLAKLKNDLPAQKEVIKSNFLKAYDLNKHEDTYNLACLCAIFKETDEAFKWLKKSMQNNRFPKSHYESDSDLDNIRSDKRFKELLDKYRPE